MLATLNDSAGFLKIGIDINNFILNMQNKKTFVSVTFIVNWIDLAYFSAGQVFLASEDWLHHRPQCFPHFSYHSYCDPLHLQVGRNTMRRNTWLSIYMLTTPLQCIWTNALICNRGGLQAVDRVISHRSRADTHLSVKRFMLSSLDSLII